MAIDFTGIDNINEYYTNHYLNTIFEDNIKDILDKWNEEKEQSEEKTPWAKIRELGKKYFNIYEKFNREKDFDNKRELQREFMKLFFEALNFDVFEKPEFISFNEENSVPVFSYVKKSNGAPYLAIIENCDFQAELILEGSILEEQFYGYGDYPKEFEGLNIEEIISKYVFSVDEPPRWVLIAGINQIALIDRTKWSEKRLLIFDLEEIYSRKEESTFKAMSVLLEKNNIAPIEGNPLLDSFDENSHKHASSVSEDLKFALRRSIEYLGNEAVRDMKERQRVAVYNKELADNLTIECLRYMYRILFILFIESRAELAYAPVKSEEYMKGYSFESLRDIIDKVKMDNDEVKNGYYLDTTIKKLFEMIFNGYPVKETIKDGNRKIFKEKTDYYNTFEINSLKSHLFDPEKTATLNKVKFRNEVLYKVIQEMSLSKPKGKKRAGRISYSQLGINQLGAVYEALLSYRGFFAEEDLYEVKKAGEKENELEVGYFVKAAQLDEYEEDERARNEDGTLRIYPKGTFIYRLAGREREKSASYYTPEVLTQCLVKYSLKELLKDKTADEILDLKICEPAMGSAAFINEAVNQLAEAYLQKKQKETGILIAHDEYTEEKQKVKMYISDRNAYGIDLNPIAVELAEVSIWLNTIYSGGFVPWFGTQLINGNSLIGARREVYSTAELKKTGKNAWWNKEPQRIENKEQRIDNKGNAKDKEEKIDNKGVGVSPVANPKEKNINHKRNKNTIYHFLTGDAGMSVYKDNVIKKMAGNDIKKIEDWRKDFIKPHSKEEIDRLLQFSEKIDELWEKHYYIRKKVDELTTDNLSVFGHKEKLEQVPTTSREKDKIFNEYYHTKGMRNSGPYARLKFVMDYWCALWFWPIDKAELLPSRDEFLMDLSLIIDGNLMPVGNTGLKLFGEDDTAKEMKELFGGLGEVNLDVLCEKLPRMTLVQEIAKKQKFLHWELEFVDLFWDNGGFDLILGNPPWLKVSWNEGGILGEYEPLFDLRKYSANKMTTMRDRTFEKYGELKKAYFGEYEGLAGTQNFLNGVQNYFELQGVQTNLYKCFLPLSWRIGNKSGVQGFLHPEGVYDDPKGGVLRERMYKRLVYHFQFQNAFILFDIAHRSKYSINIFKNKKEEISFKNISNLFTAKTIDDSFEANFNGVVSGIKDENGNWNVQGHKKRIMIITEKELEVFSKLFDEEGTSILQAKLPTIHSEQLISVLKKFADYPKRLRDLGDEYYSLEMWHETNSQNDGTIKRETRFPNSADELILSGPHFYVGEPFYKTPRAVCTEKGHYDVVDLVDISDDYLPRTNYLPACEKEEYERRIPKVKWIEEGEVEGKKVTEYYRLVHRRRLSQSGERTYIPTLAPKNIAHVHTVVSSSFKNKNNLINILFVGSSILFDYFVKSIGKGDFTTGNMKDFPVIINEQIIKLTYIRALSLNCLTTHYTELWEELFDTDYKCQAFFVQK